MTGIKADAQKQRFQEGLLRCFDPTGKSFLKSVKQERIGPFFYKAALESDVFKAAISPEDIKILERFYYATFARNIRIFDTFKNLAGLFRENGIKALFFKGPVVTASLYDDIGCRPMTDIDILVRRQDVVRAADMLSGFGYTPPFAVTQNSLPATNIYHNSLLFSAAGRTPGFVHLYWHLLNLFPYDISIWKKFDMDEIWASSREAAVEGVEVLTLADEDLLIYLCWHAFKHGYTPFILLIDICMFLLLKSGVLDWERVGGKAKRFGLFRPVYHTCLILHKLFGAAIPLEFMNRMRPPKVSFFEKKFVTQVTRGVPVRERLPMVLVYLGMNESWMGRLRYIARAAFPPREAMAIIRQKDPARVSCKDYLARIFSSIKLK
ncbi:MAG TPA: hypothetical protein DCL35_05415 [Candidatus Omnitrophica bacterium]|nr:hypothetical protein [Candidatus Omnitrophota bacterium]